MIVLFCRWSQFKAKHAESFPFQQPRLHSDRPPHSGDSVREDLLSPSGRDPHEYPGYPPAVLPPEAEDLNIPRPLLLDQANEILAEADQQLKSGKMSHEQHQEILKQLSELYRLQKEKLRLREQRERQASGGLTSSYEGSQTGSESEMWEEGPAPRRRGPPGPPEAQFSPIHPADEPPLYRGPPGPAGVDNERILRRPGDLPRSPQESPSRKAGLLPTPDMPPNTNANDTLPSQPLVESGRTGRPLPPRNGRQDAAARDGPRPGPTPREPKGPRGPRAADGLPPKMPLPNIRIPKKQNSPAPEAPRLVLPYNTEKFYIPSHDSRWYKPQRDTKTPSESCHEIYIDGKYHAVGLNQAPKAIDVADGVELSVNVDHETKQVFINNNCYYNIGDPKRSIVIGGRSYKIMYHGPMRRVWIDGCMYDVWSDAPPTRIVINGEECTCYIDALTGEMQINDAFVCKIGFEPVTCELLGATRTVSTSRPLKKILVDGQLSEMDFRGLYPCVKIGTAERGIRFDGPPREIEIDGVPFLVNVDRGRKVKFGNVNHVIAFGGPGHEVIINGTWYDCKFNGVEKEIILGMNHHTIKLNEPHPEVRILGEFVEDKKKIKQLSGTADIDPALDLDEKVRRPPAVPPRRSPPPMRNSPLLAAPSGQPKPRPLLDNLGPGPQRFDGPVKPLLRGMGAPGGPRFEGPGPRPVQEGPPLRDRPGTFS